MNADEIYIAFAFWALGAECGILFAMWVKS